MSMLHAVRSMLADNDFVDVFSFHISKAFDTVRHALLTSNLTQLALPDNIYNWVVDFLENHAHCSKYAGLVSAIAVIKPSVIQGSVIGPASCAVTAADLHPLNDHSRIFKFADYTYLVVPAVATGTCKCSSCKQFSTVQCIQIRDYREHCYIYDEQAQFSFPR